MNSAMLQALRQKVEEAHQKRFGEAPARVSFSPGRVEILGNHTDYNGGLALAAAVEQGVGFGLSLAADTEEATLVSLDLGQEVKFLPAEIRPEPGPAWAAAIKGVLKVLLGKMSACPGFNATVAGNLPHGAGLSSSAALGVSASVMFRRFLSVDISRIHMAKACQRAEVEFAGVQCGLLDPMTCLFANDRALLYLDFKDLSTHPVPFPGRLSLFIYVPGAERRLADTDYNARRAECEEAAAFVAMTKKGSETHSLRDVTPEDLDRLRAQMDPALVRRITHILGENERVKKAVEYIRGFRMKELGQLLYESHESSIRDFENSSEEQDFIVETCRSTPGVLGARLTGGGFGGAVVVLAETEHLDSAMTAVADAARKRTGAEPMILPVRPSSSARLLVGK